MITNAILNIVFGFFEWVFALLPIPSMPTWVDNIIARLSGYISQGVSMFTWLFPESLYIYVIDTCIACLLVRFSYDIYCKFHRFRSAS